MILSSRFRESRINHINVCENQACSSCVIDKFLITKRPSLNDEGLKSPQMLGLFVILRAQNLSRIKQRKGLVCIQAYSDDVDDQDDDLIAPYTFHDSVPKCNHHSRTPC